MTLADLAGRLARTADAKVRVESRVWEFLEEYRWEPADVQPSLLGAEPSLTGDERWDTLLAALAERLAAQHDLAPPDWADLRVLRRPWFPAELKIQRAMPWSGRRRPSASMAFTFPPGTLRQRE
jgi:hypothetical protein